MKHSYLLSALMLAPLLASCSSDDDGIKFSDNRIQFTASVPYATTQRQVATTGNLAAFRVWGYVDGLVYLDDRTVTKHGDQWTYDNPQYWPVKKTMNFYSIAPVNIENYIGSKLNGPDSYSIRNFRNPGNVDLLYAVNKDVPEETQVKVNFRHALSQLSFTVRCADNATFKARITSIDLVNVRNSGDFDYPDGTTDPADITKNIGSWYNTTPDPNPVNVFTGNTTVAETATRLYTDNAYMFTVPGTINPATLTGDTFGGTYAVIRCELLDSNTNLRVWPRATAPGYNEATGTAEIYVSLCQAEYIWQPGHAYNYNIALSMPNDTQPITFTGVTVDEYPAFSDINTGNNP